MQIYTRKSCGLHCPVRGLMWKSTRTWQTYLGTSSLSLTLSNKFDCKLNVLVLEASTTLSFLGWFFSLITKMSTDQMDTSNGNNAPLAASEIPEFIAVTGREAQSSGKSRDSYRRIPVPPHRLTPLKTQWMQLYTPLVEQMQLQIRFNTRAKSIEIKSTALTPEIGYLQKAADFVYAFTLGFDVADCMALLRMDDLYVESFQVKDVKTLHGDHLSRAIGRVAGKDGKTKFTIENASRTRIVLADTRIHILGSFQNIKMARDAVCALILGSPPGKVYSNLRNVASRTRERF